MLSRKRQFRADAAKQTVDRAVQSSSPGSGMIKKEWNFEKSYSNEPRGYD